MLRLTFRSGYGAGIDSPGWYHYLWHHPEDDGTWWVSRIAALLSKKDMDISVAHVIETVRLAQTTAALRGLPAPTLEEYNEAVTTVMGFVPIWHKRLPTCIPVSYVSPVVVWLMAME